MKTLICDCNHTMPLDAAALKTALQQTSGASPDGLEQLHTLLCRREAGAFQRAAKATGEAGEPLVVACTQERRLFAELNEHTEGAAPLDARPIRFVNIRETGGWSRDAKAATPKIAALLAAAQMPAPQPVPNVSYRSGGRCLIIGSAEAAEHAAAMLVDRLDVNLLIDGAGSGVAQARAWAVHSGRLTRLSGWLGAFNAEWESRNPIDLDLCTRCNACIAVCPEGAIDFSYQIDLATCKSHRECVRACDAAGAIDFERAPRTDSETFDVVLDLRPSPAFTMHQPPQGYFHAGADLQALHKAVLELRDATGEFEKPRFFQYDQKICAHSRNERIGCTACIDVCSARAISSDASLKGKLQGKVRGGPERVGVGGAKPTGGIAVEPHLCVGCGACSTVCPSGAISFAYPSTVDQGQRLRTLLRAYTLAGGRDPSLLIHSDGAGSQRIDELGRAARIDRSVHGVPARVLPMGVWHTASVGIDLWLAAFAQGANQVWVLLTDEEAPEYRQALTEQMALAQAVLSGLGYGGRHFKLIEARDARDLAALDAALREAPAIGLSNTAGFNAQASKRATLELAIDHLLKHAPQRAEAITLPAAGAPFGSLLVNPDTCTMCLACVGACPEGALLDNPERPQLRFIEKNCVQCGLCATTCPERAITLQPRLWLADDGKARREPRVLHEVEPFHCVRCGKPFGTLRAIETMIGKLAGHAAFQGAAAERLRMCGDCRVIDMHSNPNEVRITDL
ncbi:MAG TPA: 4Fe-4S dicluster domain-containing protein [Burkholderiaceae bacterium]|nr:4Fe-4S dicluster domain-containing protein [Burkholderiaceae bacterium]